MAINQNKPKELNQSNPLADLPPFVTVDEIARALRVHDETVRVLIKKRILPGTKIGRQWRVKKDDVLAFLINRGASPSSPIPGTNGHKPNRKRKSLARPSASPPTEPGSAPLAAASQE